MRHLLIAKPLARATPSACRQVLCAITLALSWAGALPATADQLTVFAASSLKGALDEIATQFEGETGHKVTLSYAGSSVLARQITLGAPADLFVSANQDWMDVLQAAGVLVDGTRNDVVGNTLVMVAPATETDPATFDLKAEGAFIARLGDGRLAMGLVNAVPAGIYGKAALDHFGLWDTVAPRVAQSDNVRAALALVALGQAPLGIVYASDARADARVQIIYAFPEGSHPPIRYPAAAIVGGNTPLAEQFLDRLALPTARAVFDAHGFATLEPS
ncbi:molybdate ABC transporter substrate-binding protein [uncultured Aliiroseovarius sp.]|uniref:molybdate ABC transporter substrate-binding protein n=1 Tax=uncultured Aliiroseovarius sp. TaxID=1658783 RepID=UPI002615CD83|nr:molybdate ABC transporter substrate-binding protein [uncultured Aliiroseovarius sp.]